MHAVARHGCTGQLTLSWGATQSSPLSRDGHDHGTRGADEVAGDEGADTPAETPTKSTAGTPAIDLLAAAAGGRGGMLAVEAPG
jgi:hypothetical protein